MSLIELLSMNERLLVWSDAETETIYTWNQSVTLQAWTNYDGAEWQEIDIRTLGGGEPKNFEEAREAAKRWAFDVREEVSS